MVRPAAFLLLALAGAVAAQPAPPGPAPWPFDVIVLKNGTTFHGLIQNETPTGVWFRSVNRRPGKPTVTVTSFYDRAEIRDLTKLPEKDRAVLRERLAEIDEGEQKRVEGLKLDPAPWPGGGTALRYTADYFVLTSPAGEEVVRRAAVRLEQLYAAFVRFLPPTASFVPPTAPGDGKTAVLLAPSKAEYDALLRTVVKKTLINPAVYDPDTNQIVCGTDLGPLGKSLRASRLHHGQERARLDRYEADVRRLYKAGAELNRHLEVIRAERRKVSLAEAANGAAFDRATARLFALLYHEGFHAYVTSFVYPPLPADRVRAGAGTGELPRWLNEGLAQVFETAVVEAGELRADHADEARLDRVKQWLKGKAGPGLLPLPELLLADGAAFRALHDDQRAAADRAYLTSWGLAHYLTFGRRLIGADAFRTYLVAVNGGGDPRAAFEGLVGRDLVTFEREWHDYLRLLHPDGTVK